MIWLCTFWLYPFLRSPFLRTSFCLPDGLFVAAFFQRHHLAVAGRIGNNHARLGGAGVKGVVRLILSDEDRHARREMEDLPIHAVVKFAFNQIENFVTVGMIVQRVLLSGCNLNIAKGNF